MAGETVITVVGNLVDDPELRFTPSGAAVANFRIASTSRTFDKQSNEWKDGDALFLSCAVWRQAAENVAESLQKGMRVVVQGRLKSRQYETREGEKRTVFEIDVEEVGPSLKYATAKVTRASRGGGGGGGYGGGWRWRLLPAGGRCPGRRPGRRPVGHAGSAAGRWTSGRRAVRGPGPVGRPRRLLGRASLLIHATPSTTRHQPGSRSSRPRHHNRRAPTPFRPPRRALERRAPQWPRQ